MEVKNQQFPLFERIQFFLVCSRVVLHNFWDKNILGEKK